GVDFPMRAVRQQISRALDLIVQIERFSDGARKITSVTEVQRMEGDTVTLQEIFEYRIDKNPLDTGGQLVYTGLRPTCGKFERHAIPLPRYMHQHSFSDERMAAATGGSGGQP